MIVTILAILTDGVAVTSNAPIDLLATFARFGREQRMWLRDPRFAETLKAKALWKSRKPRQPAHKTTTDSVKKVTSE